MKLSSFIGLLTHNFYSKLNQKTGWGKEEVKKEFEVALLETMLKILEEDT